MVNRIVSQLIKSTQFSRDTRIVSHKQGFSRWLIDSFYKALNRWLIDVNKKKSTHS